MTPVCHGTTLICYCRKAAVQHAAWSRWQPGRNRKWGLDGREKVRGEERRVWHMWVAAGDVGGVEGEQDNSGFV